MTIEEEVPLSPSTHASVPIPGAYSRQISYDVVKEQQINHTVSPLSQADTKNESLRSPISDFESLKGARDKDDLGPDGPTGKTQKSILLYLLSSRLWIRGLAIAIMIASFSLILTAVIMFAKAQNKPGHPLNNTPQPAKITDQPCIVFTGIAAMNLLFSCTILALCCISSKFNKASNALNAIFAIISAVGFATSMGACFYLNKQTTLQNDLWKWSCINHEHGIVSEVLDFNSICKIINYGWKFGLVQASLELLTFIISVTTFVLLKYSYFVRYGRLGKVF